MLLQRVASNAYSWWWASHIRTTQSKWLDANLQDMENRVKIMLKLLGEEADSFGKRAEMYYRRRPEVITHVEEVYRAYRALVERYDHLSKELHKANHTIVTSCPEQVQYAMLEQEDDNLPKAITPINSRKIQTSTVEDILKRKREGLSSQNKGVHERSPPSMSTGKAEEEISRLQKAILVLQTEKELVKSSYESGIAKYWEVEKQIADMQEEIYHIQDEYDAHADIGDDEARALMTISALRSCQGTVYKLVEKFEELIRIGTGESEKIKSLREKWYTMSSSIDPSRGGAATTNMTSDDRVCPITREILDLQPIYDRIKNFFEHNSESSVEEMAEKVDELVDKVMNLELKFPKQSAQIKQLKEDSYNLNNRLDDLQDEIALRDDPSDLTEQLKLAEDELNRVVALERSVIEEQVLVSTSFSEVFSCITNISKAFEPIRPEDLAGLSASAENGATTSEDVNMDNFTKETPATGDNQGRDTCSKGDVSEVVDHDSSAGTDGIHDSKNSNVTGNCVVEEELKDKSLIQAGNHIDRNVSSDDQIGVDRRCEGKTDCSLEEQDWTSVGGTVTNINCNMENDGTEKFAQDEILKGEHPPIAVSRTHLPHSESIHTSKDKYDPNVEGSSLEVAESPFDGSNGTQDMTIESFVPGSSLIHEEGLGDGESIKTPGQITLVGSASLYSLSNGDPTEENSLPVADRSRVDELCHANEAKQGGQLAALEEDKSLNECSKVDSSKEVGCASLGDTNSIQDVNNSVLVDAYSSGVRDGTSLDRDSEETDVDAYSSGVRDGTSLDRDSEETNGMHQQVPQVTAKSDITVSHIPDGQLEKRIPNGKVLAREASTLNNHGSSSQRDKSNLIAQDDLPSWQEFLLNGLENRDAILLNDYTSVLKSYKETKRRLAELEKKNQQHLEETKAVIRELRTANSMKYVEIQSLRNILDSSEMPPTPNKMSTDRSNQTFDREISIVKETDSSHGGALKNASPFEVKFRSEIDTLVEENLQFLVRYSMACHRMQDFDRKYQELLNEVEKSEDKTGETNGVTEPEAAEKKLRELKTELDVWFEHYALLDQDLRVKTTSLCRLQEEIAEALRASPEVDNGRFRPYEAAKFQGAVLNMQQSNNGIESELQAALERMRELEGKVNDGLQKLRESFELSSRRSPVEEAESSSYNSQFKHFPSRTRVPLRNFLFGAKPKKKSLFACINPTLQKQFSDL